MPGCSPGFMKIKGHIRARYLDGVWYNWSACGYQFNLESTNLEHVCYNPVVCDNQVRDDYHSRCQ